MLRPALALALFVAAVAARAAHPLITEDTATVSAGRWQLEGLSEQFKERATRRRVQLEQLVLSRGLNDRLDLQVDLPWYRDGADDIGDLAVDLKWRFLERGAFSLGLKPGFTLPTGDERDGRGTGRITWGALLIGTYRAPGPLELHAHAGWLKNRNRIGERDSLAHLSAAVAYRIGEVKLVADYARNTARDPAASGSERYRVLGAIWSVRRDFDLDIGWKSGEGAAPIDDALLLGTTLRW